jgi:WD40 repeat protein
VWDARTLECEAVLEGHTEAVLALALAEGGGLVSGSYDTTLRVWAPGAAPGAPWRCVRRAEGHGDAVRVLAVGEDGHIFSGSYDGTVGVW